MSMTQFTTVPLSGPELFSILILAASAGVGYYERYWESCAQGGVYIHVSITSRGSKRLHLWDKTWLDYRRKINFDNVDLISYTEAVEQLTKMIKGDDL